MHDTDTSVFIIYFNLCKSFCLGINKQIFCLFAVNGYRFHFAQDDTCAILFNKHTKKKIFFFNEITNMLHNNMAINVLCIQSTYVSVPFELASSNMVQSHTHTHTYKQIHLFGDIFVPVIMIISRVHEDEKKEMFKMEIYPSETTVFHSWRVNVLISFFFYFIFKLRHHLKMAHSWSEEKK